MGELSEKIIGFLKRFNCVHFSTNIVTSRSEKYRSGLESKMYSFALEFSTCLSHHLFNETELSITGGILLLRSVILISRLQKSTQMLDYKSHITCIYSSYHNMISRLVKEGVFLVLVLIAPCHPLSIILKSLYRVSQKS